MCGIVGIMGNGNVAQELFDGLTVLQHRGQDAAGIMTYDKNKFHLKKGNGLAREIFHTKNMMRLKGDIGLGHVRYTTAGNSDNAEESQPFYVNTPFGICLIHNGNLTNTEELRKEVAELNIRQINTGSDSEVLLNVVADEILKLRKIKLKPQDIFKAITAVYGRLKGSYSVIAIIAGHGVLAFRDPHAFRPLVLGIREDEIQPEYIVASETVAVGTLGYKVVSDIQPGEAVFIDLQRKVHRQICGPQRPSPCIFEHVYLARPDSVIDKVSVYKARLRMGKKLAKQIKKSNLKIDTVIPIPETSRTAAVTLAYELGVKLREGLIKNRYIGRTFIMPGQKARKQSVRFKLNPIELEIRNKNILLVDDSIVRGNTMKKIIEMVRSVGAKKVYVASCAPPLKSPCVYGVDMPTRQEFVAYDRTIEEIEKEVGADKLFYQSNEDLVNSAKEGNPEIKNYCTACFTGKYPTRYVTDEYLRKVEEDRLHKVKTGIMDEVDGEGDSEEQMSLV